MTENSAAPAGSGQSLPNKTGQETFDPNFRKKRNNKPSPVSIALKNMEKAAEEMKNKATSRNHKIIKNEILRLPMEKRRATLIKILKLVQNFKA